jgi:hypothetical protein
MSASDPIPPVAVLLHQLREQLPMMTVYDHPSDWPEYYVARLFVTLPELTATPVCFVSGDLQPIHDQLTALGLRRMERHPQDDPAIMETWL